MVDVPGTRIRLGNFFKAVCEKIDGYEKSGMCGKSWNGWSWMEVVASSRPTKRTSLGSERRSRDELGLWRRVWRDWSCGACWI